MNMVHGETVVNVGSVVGKVRSVTQWEWHAIMTEVMHSNKWEQLDDLRYVDKQGNELELVVMERDQWQRELEREVVAVDYFDRDGLFANRITQQVG